MLPGLRRQKDWEFEDSVKCKWVLNKVHRQGPDLKKKKKNDKKDEENKKGGSDEVGDGKEEEGR